MSAFGEWRVLQTMEVIFFGALPAIVGLALLAGALRRLGGRRQAISRAVSIIVLALSGTALWLLWRIFIGGAWPAALPHLFLAVALVFVLLEQWLVERRPVTAE